MESLKIERTKINLEIYGEKYKVRRPCLEEIEEMDEKTESIILEISAHDINFDLISEKIEEMGGSIHSIDEVDVVNAPEAEKG